LLTRDERLLFDAGQAELVSVAKTIVTGDRWLAALATF